MKRLMAFMIPKPLSMRFSSRCREPTQIICQSACAWPQCSPTAPVSVNCDKALLRHTWREPRRFPMPGVSQSRGKDALSWVVIPTFLEIIGLWVNRSYDQPVAVLRVEHVLRTCKGGNRRRVETTTRARDWGDARNVARKSKE